MREFIIAGIIASFTVSVQASGTLYFSEDRNSNGLYTLNPTTGAATHLGASGAWGDTVGLAESGSPDVLYGSHPFYILHINADGSGASSTAGVCPTEGLAYDPSGVLYGVSNGSFFTVDPIAGTKIANLAAPGFDVEGLAWASGGVYGLSGPDFFAGGTGAGTLLRYDIATDSWTVVGLTGVGFDNVGLAYDAEAGILYAKGNQDSYLYGIDPLTASAWQIGNTGIVNGGGLAFVGDAAAPVVPAPAAILLGGVGAGLVGWLRRRRTL